MKHLHAIAARDGGYKCHYCGCETWTDYEQIKVLETHYVRSMDGMGRAITEWCVPQHLVGKDAAVDHVIPKSRGGSHKIENLVISCSRCNSTKGGKTDAEFFAWLQKKASEHHE